MANNNAFYTIRQNDARQQGQAHPPAQQYQQRPAFGQQTQPYIGQHHNLNHVQMMSNLPGVTVISDVSQGLMTDEDRRNALTSYTSFQWEKIPSSSDSDVTNSRKSHWEQTIRTQEHHISERDIVKQIKHLDRTTKHYLDKKKDLDTAAQRQITAAQEQLTLSDNDRGNFRWILVQIDHKLRELPPADEHSYEAILDQGQSTSRTSKSRGRIGARPRSSSKARRTTHHIVYSQPKRRYERVSLIAYFKREPLEHADIQRLYSVYTTQHQQQAHANQIRQIQPQINPQQNYAPPRPPQQQPRQPAQVQQPGRKPEEKRTSPMRRPVERVQEVRDRAQRHYKNKNGRKRTRILGSESDSESSGSSSGSDTNLTVPSSQDDIRNRKPRLYRPPSRGTSRERHCRQRHVRLPPDIHQRALSRDRIIVQDSRTRLSSATVLEQAEERAFRAGQQHEQRINADIQRGYKEVPQLVTAPHLANSGMARHVKVALAATAPHHRRPLPYILDEYYEDESEDYGLAHLSLGNHGRRGSDQRYNVQDEGRYAYASSSPTETQDSVFSEDPFILRRPDARYRSRSPVLRTHFIETRDERPVYGRPRNRFAPRQTPPTF